MKTLVVAVILVILPSPALSHPGKTDRRGGHKCWKGCAEWELLYKEYHLHDENFRPVRPAEAKTAAGPIMEGPSSSAVALDLAVENKPVEEMTKEEIPVAGAPARKKVTSKGDVWIIDPLLLLSAALLLLLLLVISRTSRKRNEAPRRRDGGVS